MSQRVTIAQVAAHAGVSPMTVSNVLNERPGASDATRQRVLNSARTLGYVPNFAARGLKAGRVGLVGVALADLTSQYALEIIRGISEELAVPEIEILIGAAPAGEDHEQARLEMFSKGLTDGLILIAPVLADETVAMLRRSRQPIVVVDPRRFDCPFPNVVIDNYGGMRSLTERVLAAGHSDILFLSGNPAFDTSEERRNAFIEATSLAGVSADRIAYRGEGFTYEDGFDAVSTFLREQVPTAIIASSDIQAFGAIDAVRAIGLRIPEDVSVVGFDDVPQAANSFPGLTTVRQPLADMGRIATRTLLSALDGTPPIQHRIELQTTLIERGSLGPPRSDADS